MFNVIHTPNCDVVHNDKTPCVGARLQNPQIETARGVAAE